MSQDQGQQASSGIHNPDLQVAAGGERGISVSDILRALRKGKWLIVACLVLGAVISLIEIAFIKPVYEANASIRLDPSRVESLGLQDIVGNLGGDEQQTEMAILRSDVIALDTLNSLPPDAFRKFAGFDKSSMVFVLNGRPLTRAQEGVISAFKLSVHVKQIEGTQLLQLSFRNGDPELSALILNHLLDTYLRQNFDSRYNSVNQVRTWLDSQMEDLRTRADKAQKQLADFQEANNFLGTDASNNTVVNNLKLLSSQLAEAEGQRIIKEAQMRAAEEGDPAVLTSLAPNAKISALQTQEAALYAQEVQLSSKFGANYPPLKDVRDQLATVKREIAQNLNLVSGRFHEEYKAASNAEKMLRDEYASATQDAYALNRKQTDYAVLLGEVTSNRSLLNTLQRSLQQATVDAGLNSVNTMIVDRARVPLDPIEPRKTLLLSFGLMLGLAAGVGSALLRAALSDSIQSIEDVEVTAGLVSLAVIPHMEVEGQAIEGSPASSPLVTVREPKSRAAEAYRNLRNSVLLSSIDRPITTVLFTSALPGEGKSSTSSNYAVVLAQKGARVLLVDADLRRPRLHTQMRVPNGRGITSLISGEIDHPEITTPIPELPNLHFIPAGRSIPFPSEALGSAKFRSLLAKWREEYESIVIDSAPVLSVSDTLPVASWVDRVVLVVRAGVTPVSALVRAKATLLRAKASLAGVVLNDLSSSDERYGYYGYYGRGANGYYEE